MADISLSTVLAPDLDRLVRSIKDEQIAQGHNASGALLASWEWRTQSETATEFTAVILSFDYARYLETGTRPHRPPYGAIRRWVDKVNPGATKKENDGFAWAVVKTIEKVGTPSAGSFRFSSNGSRAKQIENALTQAEDAFYFSVEQKVPDFLFATLENELG